MRVELVLASIGAAECGSRAWRGREFERLAGLIEPAGVHSPRGSVSPGVPVVSQVGESLPWRQLLPSSGRGLGLEQLVILVEVAGGRLDGLTLWLPTRCVCGRLLVDHEKLELELDGEQLVARPSLTERKLIARPVGAES